MAKLEWGTKRVCQSCATKFYDFGRTPIVCPKCGASFDPETLLKARRSRPSAASKPVKAAKAPAPAKESEAEAEAEDEDIELDDDLEDIEDSDDEDAVLEDASDLEDDDVSDVVSPAESDDEER